MTHELVAGKTNDAKATAAVGLLEFLETRVLRSEAALRSDVDEQRDVTVEFGEGRGRAVEAGDGVRKDAHDTTLRVRWSSCFLHFVGMPDTFRALCFRDDDIVVEERLSQEPAPLDVVVAVRAAGLNAADLLQRRGWYPAPPGWPADIPGLECAGEVMRVGRDVDATLLGRRVAAIVGGGGQAEECHVPSEHLILLPDSVSWAAAGGFAEAFTTAFDALVLQANIQPGERVAISGAAGGVGVAAVQIARAIGAHVTAVTRDASHHGALTALGAHECVTLESVGEIAPVNVILELVGAAHLSVAQRVLLPRARVVVIGVGGGGRVELDLLALMSTRATITGSTLRARSRSEKADIAAALQRDVIPWLADGAVSIPVHSVVALEDAANAYDEFARPGKFGKIVLSTTTLDH